MKDFGFPDISIHADEVIQEYVYFESQEEILFQKSVRMLQSLNLERTYVFNTIVQYIESPNNSIQQPHCYFLEGKAGHGKTYTVNTIVNYLQGQYYIVLICGSTALSVILYDKGYTAHNLFKIPINQVYLPFNLIF